MKIEGLKAPLQLILRKPKQGGTHGIGRDVATNERDDNSVGGNDTVKEKINHS